MTFLKELKSKKHYKRKNSKKLKKRKQKEKEYMNKKITIIKEKRV